MRPERWNGLPSISEQIFSNGARAITTSPGSWFSAFLLALESCFLFLFFSLPKAHKSFRSDKGFKYHFWFFPYQENQQRAMAIRAPCWLWWTPCVSKGYARKQHLWEHFEATGNSQEGAGWWSTSCSCCPEIPRDPPRCLRAHLRAQACSYLCCFSCTRPDALHLGIDIWCCQSIQWLLISNVNRIYWSLSPKLFEGKKREKRENVYLE